MNLTVAVIKTVMILLFALMFVAMPQFFLRAREAWRTGSRNRFIHMILGVVVSFVVGAWAFAMADAKITTGLSIGWRMCVGSLIESVGIALFVFLIGVVEPWAVRRFSNVKPESIHTLALAPVGIFVILMFA